MCDLMWTVKDEHSYLNSFERGSSHIEEYSIQHWHGDELRKRKRHDRYGRWNHMQNSVCNFSVNCCYSFKKGSENLSFPGFAVFVADISGGVAWDACENIYLRVALV